MPTPNLLNPGNDPYVDERLRRGLLNLGTAFATGGPGVPGDIAQGAISGATGLLNAQMNAIDPTGRVRAMSGQMAPLQSYDVPYTSENLQRGLGGDPSAPESLLGFIGAPEVTDVAKIGALVGKGGLLAQSLFHGTPHKFDKFELEKIGTGEGAQAYGHGLYFAENPGVAGSYQKGLSKIDPDNVTYDGRSVEDLYVSAQKKQDAAHRLKDEKKIQEANAELYLWESLMTRNNPDVVLDEFLDPDYGWPEAKKLAERIDRSKFKGVEAGHLYEVYIPDPTIAKMLDWDAPLSEQPESVRKALEPLTDFWKQQGTTQAGIDSWRGEQLYERSALLGNRLGITGGSRQEVASKTLQEFMGIPGIRYYDGASRSAQDGTRNIVVFNPDDIKQVKRDGELVYKTGLLGDNALKAK